jgi:pyroglutamyl-peptidase
MRLPADSVPPDAFRVLLTGFGPFMHYRENPSWLAVRPLQNTLLHTHITPLQVQASNAAAAIAASKSTSAAAAASTKAPIPPIDIPNSPRPIHITTLQIPVLYEAVLDKVPPLYSRPPVLPDDAPSDTLAPPPNGFDFVFHIGVAGRGPLRMERVGHKLGYHMKDASGKYAPVVKVIPKDFSRREQGSDANGPGAMVSASPFIVSGATLSIIDSMEKLIIDAEGSAISGSAGDAFPRPTRGFGVGYENLQDEYTTDIDVTRLVSDMKKAGVEVCPLFSQI